MVEEGEVLGVLPNSGLFAVDAALGAAGVGWAGVADAAAAAVAGAGEGAGAPKSEDHNPLFDAGAGDGAAAVALGVVVFVVDVAAAGDVTVGFGGVGRVALVDTLMDGVKEKSAALVVSFFPKMSDKSVVSFRKECIDEEVVVGPVDFWIFSVGGECVGEDDEIPKPRSSLFVLVGSISKLRSSMGTTRSVDGDPGTAALRSMSILFTVLVTGVEGRLDDTPPTSMVLSVSVFRRLISDKPLISGRLYVSYETRGHRNHKGGDLELQRQNNFLNAHAHDPMWLRILTVVPPYAQSKLWMHTLK